MPEHLLEGIPAVTHPKSLKLPKQFDARTAWPQCSTIGRILGYFLCTFHILWFYVFFLKRGETKVLTLPIIYDVSIAGSILSLKTRYFFSLVFLKFDNFILELSSECFRK